MQKAKTAQKATPATQQRTRKASLIVPSLSIKKMQTGESLFIKVQSEIMEKPALDDNGSQKKDKQGKPAVLHLIRAIDMDTGLLGEMVLPFMVHKGFADAGKLTGREFELVKGKTETGKTTHWEVHELEQI